MVNMGTCGKSKTIDDYRNDFKRVEAQLQIEQGKKRQIDLNIHLLKMELGELIQVINSIESQYSDKPKKS